MSGSFLTDDLDGMFDTDEFAVTATVDGTDISALFDAEFAESLEIEGASPMLTCKTSDVSSVSHGDTVVVDGTNYTVNGIAPDSYGVTVLILREA